VGGSLLTLADPYPLPTAAFRKVGTGNMVRPPNTVVSVDRWSTTSDASKDPSARGSAVGTSAPDSDYRGGPNAQRGRALHLCGAFFL